MDHTIAGATSAVVTFMPLTYTPLAFLVRKMESPPAVTTLAFGPAGTWLAVILESSATYKRILLRSVEDKVVTVALLRPDAAQASLLGANTVKVRGPLSVDARLAVTTADFRIEKLASADTISVIVPVVGLDLSAFYRMQK